MSGKYLDETGLVHLWNKIKDLQSVLGGGSKEELFRDVWNAACGVFGRYNEKTGFYELNGLTDLTYEDALLVFTESNSRNLISPSTNISSLTYESAQYTGVKARTIFPSVCDACDYYKGFNGGYIKNKVIIANSDIESITLLDENKTTPNRETKEGAIQVKYDLPASPTPLIYNCPNLKYINSVISFNCDEPASYEFFVNCPNLEECCICNDGKHSHGLSFVNCPNISWQSLYYSRMNSKYWSKVTTNVHKNTYDKFFSKHPFLGSWDGDASHYIALDYERSSVATEEEAILFLNYFKKYFGDPIYTDEEAISKLCTTIDADNTGYIVKWGVENIMGGALNMILSIGDVITRCSKSDLANPNHPWHNIPWEGLDTNQNNNVESDIIAALDIDTVKLMEKSFVDNDLSTAMTYIVTKIVINEDGWGGHANMIPVCALSPISTYAPSGYNIHNHETLRGVNCKVLPWSFTYRKLFENSSTISYS